MGTSSSTHHQTSSSGQGASESLNTNPPAPTDSPQTQATPTPPCTTLDPATPVRPRRAASSAISYADMHRGHASFGEMGSRARQALAMVARGEARTLAEACELHQVAQSTAYVRKHRSQQRAPIPTYPWWKTESIIVDGVEITYQKEMRSTQEMPGDAHRRAVRNFQAKLRAMKQSIAEASCGGSSEGGVGSGGDGRGDGSERGDGIDIAWTRDQTRREREQETP